MTLKKTFTPNTNLYLIGPMGSGKSSIGLQLAKLSGRIFYDSDREIEQRCGVSIHWIFEKEQEAGFRRREASIIKELCQRKAIVLSTGGGTIVNQENRALLNSTGFVIYLQVSAAEQLERTQLRRLARPLLQDNPSLQLEKLNKERSPLYESIADLIITTDHKEPNNIAKKIWNELCSMHS